MGRIVLAADWNEQRQQEHDKRSNEFWQFYERLKRFHTAVEAGDWTKAEAAVAEQREVAHAKQRALFKVTSPR